MRIRRRHRRVYEFDLNGYKDFIRTKLIFMQKGTSNKNYYDQVKNDYDGFYLVNCPKEVL